MIGFIVSMPMVICSVLFMTKPDGYVTNELAYRLLLLSMPLLNLLIGAVFLLRTDLVLRLIWRKSAETDLPTTASAQLSFWITLIGVYYFISSSAGVASQLYVLATERLLRGSYWFSTYFPKLVILPLSIFCILKARMIAEFIVKKQGAPEKPENAEEDRNGHIGNN
jgi:hypothetical protein